MTTGRRIQNRCLVRRNDCKRIFGGSRTCFIACPNSEEIALELEIVCQKLRESNIEPFIAVERREYHKDIFCEKICAKIIESLFCIVLLNDVLDENDKIRKPNANVYYELGLMTAFEKRIIPVQRKDHSLAFNIQSLDTLKYDEATFASEIEDAIRTAIIELGPAVDNTNVSELPITPDWAILDLLGLARSNREFASDTEKRLQARALGFELYDRAKDGCWVFVGQFEPATPSTDVYIRAKVLTAKVEAYCRILDGNIDNLRSAYYPDEDYVDIAAGLEHADDLEGLKDQLANSAVLVIKSDLQSPDEIAGRYADYVKSTGFGLALEILDEAGIKKLLES